MKWRYVTLPTIGLIAGTRAMLGLGIGLLVAGRMSRQQRQAAGWALVAMGAATTVPLIAQVLGATCSTDAPNVGQREMPMDVVI